jgi:hypothetical protein
MILKIHGVGRQCLLTLTFGNYSIGAFFKKNAKQPEEEERTSLD